MANGDERAKGGNGCLVLAMLSGIALVVTGVVIETVDWTPEQAPAVGSEPAPAAVAPSVPPLPIEPSSSSALWEPTPEPLPILWTAEVIASPGLEPGSPCTLALAVARGRNEIVPREATLRCAGSIVRRTALASAEVHEIPLGDGWYAYRATFDAGGLVAESGARTLSVDGAGTFLLDDLSVPRRAAPFFDANAALVADVQHRLVRAAVPIAVDGAAPAALADAMRAGSACELIGDATTFDEAVDCRLLFRCGSTILYGASTSGYIACAVRDGRIVSGDDTGETPADTDPRVHLDVDAGSLVVSDTTEAGSWSARFRLEEDARCELDGTWRGVAIDTSGNELSFVLDASAGPTLRWTGGRLDGATEALSGTSDCASAEVVLHTGTTSNGASASYRLRFGGGMRSLAGSSDRAPDGDLVLSAWPG